MPLTPEVRKRINWICKKLERTANVPDPNVLQCDIEVTAVERTLQEKRFQAEIYFVTPQKSIRAIATAEDVVAALDMAHDEIERKFFREKRSKQSTRKVKDFIERGQAERRKVDEAKGAAYAKAPSWRVMKRRKFGEEEN